MDNIPDQAIVIARMDDGEYWACAEQAVVNLARKHKEAFETYLEKTTAKGHWLKVVPLTSLPNLRQTDEGKKLIRIQLEAHKKDLAKAIGEVDKELAALDDKKE